MNKKEKDTEKKPKQKAQAKEETSKANETEEKEEDVKKEEKDPVQQELDDTKDRLLRLTAEYSNYKRRSEKEKQDAYVYAKSDTIKALLPVIDNLERALANETKDYDALKKGVEMTRAQLGGLLIKIQYNRNEMEFIAGNFRMRGPYVDIFPPYGLNAGTKRT